MRVWWCGCCEDCSSLDMHASWDWCCTSATAAARECDNNAQHRTCCRCGDCGGVAAACGGCCRCMPRLRSCFGCIRC